MIERFTEEKYIKLPYAEIPSGLIKNLRRAYERKDYEYGLELALCAMEMCLYGEYHSDSERVGDVLDPLFDRAHDKVSSYVEKVKSTQETIVESKGLDVIAECYRKGYTQAQIVKELQDRGIYITQSTVSRRLKEIKEKYSYLLSGDA